MSDATRVSRRGLFTLGAVRVAEDVATRIDPLLPESPEPPVDRDDWAQRQATARAQSRADGLWAPAARRMLDAVQVRDGGRLLAVGDGDDLHDLPFGDASFDGVVSCFAPMFCPDAQAAFSELCRVVRPGGTVTFTAWKRSGLVGRLLLLAAEHDPLPRGVVAPVSWGREASVRPNLRAHCDLVEFEHPSLALSFTRVQDAVDRLIDAVPPLAAVPEQAPFRDAVRACVDETAEQDEAGATILDVPYILARAVPREPE